MSALFAIVSSEASPTPSSKAGNNMTPGVNVGAVEMMVFRNQLPIS
jgi:hypothetical protein